MATSSTSTGCPARPASPILLVVHGLEGSVDSHYVGGLFRLAAARGWRAALLYFRSCSGELNRLPRFYHSGETGDLDHVIRTLGAREPDAATGGGGRVDRRQRPDEVARRARGGCARRPGRRGGDLGAVRPRGLRADHGPAAASVCCTRAASCARCARRSRPRPACIPGSSTSRPRGGPGRSPPTTGPSRRRCTASPTRKTTGGGRAACRTWRACGAPRCCSPRSTIPFIPGWSLPDPRTLPPAVRAEFVPHGGHVGFVEGRPWRATSWAERRAVDFLATVFDTQAVC